MAKQDEKPSSETLEIQGEGLLVNVDYEKRRTVIEQRYEWVHILNDFLLGVWFLAGSIFFFFKNLMVIGTWCFTLGSAQILIGPVIRIINKLHLRRLG